MRKFFTAASLALLAVTLSSVSAYAQRGGFGGGGGFPGGGFPGGGGFGGGGFPGGGGGFGGGGFGGGGGDMIGRLDANSNGTIEPSEMQGGAGRMLRRMAEGNPSIDLSKPIPVSQLTAEMGRFRERMGGGGGFPGGGFPGGGFPGGGFPGGGDDNGGNNAAASAAPKKPTVPGFGPEFVAARVPGFGEDSAAAATPVTDEDRNNARRFMEFLDRNRDGSLDGDEWARTRQGDMTGVDVNGDGKISQEEFAIRIARRRTEGGGEGEQQGQGGWGGGRGGFGGGGFGGGGFGGGFGGGGEGGRDRGGFGGGGGFPGGGGGFPGGGFGGGGFGGGGFGGGGGFPGGGDQGGGDAGGGEKKDEEAAKDTRKSYRFKTAAERLPKGLDDWFLKGDADQDGQVTMAEYATTWTDEKIAEFGKFDANADGVITADECADAKKNKIVKKSESLAGSASPAGGGASDKPAQGGAVAGSPPATTTPAAPSAAVAAASASASLANIDDKTKEYFQKAFTRNDANGDGKLDAEERTKAAKDPSPADKDGDDMVTFEEYVLWRNK